MEDKNNMNNEIEATLNSLDNVSGAEASPYFYTRLEARLQQRKAMATEGFFQKILQRPAIAVSMLTVFLVLNIIALKSINSTNNFQQAKASSSLQNFAMEYNMNTGSVYNSER